MKLIFTNHGLKGGKELPKADLYLDCRGVANPFHQASLASLTGDSKAVQNWVMMESPDTIVAFKHQIEEGLTRIPIRRRDEADPYSRPFTICCMCAHGIHRSRAVKHILASYYKGQTTAPLGIPVLFAVEVL